MSLEPVFDNLPDGLCQRKSGLRESKLILCRSDKFSSFLDVYLLILEKMPSAMPISHRDNFSNATSKEVHNVVLSRKQQSLIKERFNELLQQRQQINKEKINPTLESCGNDVEMQDLSQEAGIEFLSQHAVEISKINFNPINADEMKKISREVFSIDTSNITRPAYTEPIFDIPRTCGPDGSKIQRAFPDGNCLFNCLSLILTGTERHHLTIRKRICQHIKEDRDGFWRHRFSNLHFY